MWNNLDTQHQPHLSASHLNSLKLPRSTSSKGRKGCETRNEEALRTCSMKEWQEQKISERQREMEEYGWRGSRGGPRWQWLIIHFITSCSAPLLLLWGFFLLFHCSSVGCCAHLCVYTLMIFLSLILSPPSSCFQPPTTFSPVFPLSLPPPASLSLLSPHLSLSGSGW